MLERGERGEKSWVVNVSSIGGLLPSPLMAPYSVTKFGVLALTESLHYEMRMKGAPVQVSVVTPGSVKSEIFRAARPGETAPPEIAAFNAQLQQLADEHGLTPGEHAMGVPPAGGWGGSSTWSPRGSTGRSRSPSSSSPPSSRGPT
ncbi:SDR family NAD(P)-dependent oxidoreductase [Streptomyces sp. NPDC003943]